MKRYRFITDISGLDRKKLAVEINEIIKDGWGDLGINYIKSHILTSQFLILALYNHEIVAFSSVREIPYEKSVIYYMEFTSIKESHQGNKLSIILNKKIFWKIMLDSLKNLHIGFQVMTISPNPRVLGSIARTAQSIYPNPYKEIPPSEEIWNKVQYLVETIGDPYNRLEKDKSILQGFYDCIPDLIYNPKEVPLDKDPEVNEFANKHLRFEEQQGREFVIYARYTLLSLLWRIFC